MTKVLHPVDKIIIICWAFEINTSIEHELWSLNALRTETNDYFTINESIITNINVMAVQDELSEDFHSL